jgi:triphosphatase
VQEAALAQIALNRAGVLRSTDPRYLHQLRVGLRRLQSAIRAFRPLLPKKGSGRLARRAKRAMRVLGAARDWDVFVAWLESAAASREALVRARRHLGKARRAARRAVAKLALGALRPDPRSTSLDEFAAASLGRLEARARKQARRMDWDDPDDRHALRVRVKRLRYASEFFGRETAKLKRMQDLLGGLNDIEVARRLLGELALREPALLQALDRRERRLLRSLARMKTSSFGHTSGRRG